MIADAPEVTLLLKAQQAIAARNFQADAGTGTAVTVRQARNRNPVRAARPCITLIMVTAAPTQADIGLNMNEKQWRMTLDIQADAELATEESGTDPTAIALLARMLAVSVAALRDPAGAFAPFCDWIEGLELDPDDRATPEDGRMTRSVNVVYRTLSEDENVLLAQGVVG